VLGRSGTSALLLVSVSLFTLDSVCSPRPSRLLNMLDDDERELHNAYHTDTVLNTLSPSDASARLSPAMLKAIERIGLVRSSLEIDSIITNKRATN